MGLTKGLAACIILLCGSRTVLAGSLNDFAILPSYGRTFQVTPPEKASSNRCVINAMQHSFGNSIGQPFVGKVDSAKCPQNFYAVEMELTIVAKGHQFDRLGFIHVDDIEVWRTSTFEPSPAGTYSVTKKDITKYRAMFHQPRTLTVAIDNIVDQTYTAALNATLNIIYLYSAQGVVDDVKTSGSEIQAAQLVLPIAAQSSSQDDRSSVALVSAAKSTVTLPKNVERAVLEVYASGHGDEEFWYTHVPNDYVDILPDTVLPGNGALREVQVMIDGQLAGFVWPFPAIYTGGLSPGLWRPIAGIDAFDQMSYDLDISPFLGKLCDSSPHQITFSVVGTDDQVAKDWFISGNVQLWLNPSNVQTTGEAVAYDESNGFSSGVSESQMPIDSSGSSEYKTELSYNAQRFFQVSARIHTGQASKTVTWVQNMTFVNTQRRYGDTTEVVQQTDGNDQSSYYSRDYSYPLSVNGTYRSDDGEDFSVTASVVQGKKNHLAMSTNPVWHKVDTTLRGSSSYSMVQRAARSTGTTRQDYTFTSSNAGQEHVVVAAKDGKLIGGTGASLYSVPFESDDSTSTVQNHTVADEDLKQYASSTILKMFGVRRGGKK